MMQVEGQDQGDDAEVDGEDDSDSLGGVAHLLGPVLPYRGRLNAMRTDMPHFALSGPDPPLLRPNVFHVSGLPGEWGKERNLS